jgi:hypothetical protein
MARRSKDPAALIEGLQGAIKARDLYSERLVAALESAQREKWPMAVRGGCLCVDLPDETELALPAKWPGQDVLDLHLLEQAIEQAAEQRAEEARLAALRESARAKLTDEELLALGLRVR